MRDGLQSNGDYVIERGGIIYRIRKDMVRALEAYVNEGTPVGGFLKRVISNDLVGAIGYADSDNYFNIQAYADYLHNEMPMYSWGSMERYNTWRKEKADELGESKK